MKYIVFLTTDPKKATHQDANGKLVFFKEVPDNATVETKSAVLTDLTGYTPLQSYLAKQSADLQKSQENGIDAVKQQLVNLLAKGVTVGTSSLKAKHEKMGLKVGASPNLTLSASNEDLILFGQGMTLLSAAAPLFPDPVTFGNTMISEIFGRGVTDITNTVHDMTVNQYTTMVLQLGAVVGQQQGDTVGKVNQIKAATTDAEIDAIVNKSHK